MRCAKRKKHWRIYRVETEGQVKRSADETKQAGWFSIGQIKALAQRTEKYHAGKVSEKEWQRSPGLEPIWREWFGELGIILEPLRQHRVSQG